MAASHHSKRKFCKEEIGSPLPIPIASLTGLPESTGNWSHYNAILKNGTIIVEDSSKAEALWNNGYFGSGNLSSSGMHYKANADIVTEARYERKEEWCSMQENSLSSSSEEKMAKTILCMKKCAEEERPLFKPLHDPFPLDEHLTLTLEEAFFLSYGLGALVVSDGVAQMNIQSMWLKFKEINPMFPVHYAVYHHFRCKGWVVKPGLKFGGDWLLYKIGPPHHHADYVVWIACLWKDTMEVDHSLSSRRNALSDISSVERLANHTSKKALICYVFRPRSLTDKSLLDVACLKEFEITQAIIQRWLPTVEDKPNNQPSQPS